MHDSPEQRIKFIVPEYIAQGRMDEVQFSLGDLERVLGIAVEVLSKPVAQPEYSFTPSVEQQPVVDELDARRTANENAVTAAEVNQTRYGVSNAQEAA